MIFKGKRKLLSVLTAAVMLAGTAGAVVPTAGAAADPVNLISNSTFDTGTKDWAIYKESGGAATLSTTSDGRLAVNISSLGKVNYAVQLYYDIVPLYENATYHMHFEISSSTDRFVEFMIQQNGGKYTAYNWKGLDLTSEPLVMDYEFTMDYETDIMSKLCFNLGIQKTEPDIPQEHTIYLDNVSLELVGDSAVNYEEVGPY